MLNRLIWYSEAFPEVGPLKFWLKGMRLSQFYHHRPDPRGEWPLDTAINVVIVDRREDRSTINTRRIHSLDELRVACWSRWDLRGFKRFFLVEDISPAVADTLGSTFNIPPHFLCDIAHWVKFLKQRIQVRPRCHMLKALHDTLLAISGQ